jgi:hypothetical protein
MSFLPPIVASQLIEDSLPWARSSQLHIDDFLSRYSLHDSYWIGLHADCGCVDSVIAVFRFDPYWNSSVSRPTPTVADWPLLFLRFNSVNTIRLSRFTNNGDGHAGISHAAVEHITDEEVVTVIQAQSGALVSLQHFPLVDGLVLSANGEYVELGCRSD